MLNAHGTHGMEKRMKQSEILRYQPAEKTNPYPAVAWTLLLAVLLSGGALLAMEHLWATEVLSLMRVFAIAIVTVVCCAAGKCNRRLSFLWIVPLLFVFIITGFRGCPSGGMAWINDMLSRWNSLHEDGLALFSCNASLRDRAAFASLMAVLMGLLAWQIAAGRRLYCGGAFCLFWLILSLLGGGFFPPAFVLLLTSVFGMMLSDHAQGISGRGMVWCGGIAIVLCLCAVLLSNTEMASVDALRQNIAQDVHDMRYGADVLPEGELNHANRLHESKEDMLQIRAEQQKMLYLRGYVGGKYENGVWSPLPDSAYGGENIGMLEWLKQQNFDPFTQASEYYRLFDSGQTPEDNRVRITVNGASRDSIYAPASLEKLTDGRAKAQQDSTLRGRGFFGLQSYTLTEVSGLRPSELMVAGDWVNAPRNEAQARYVAAEAVYRKFVYENYTAVDEKLLPLLNRIFKEGETENDGIYSVVSHIREVLKAQASYTEAVPIPHNEEDPIRYFLTASHKGNAVLYAATAVQALRAYGIPARYAEGYYLPASKIKAGISEAAVLTGENAHAWAEVYFDGIGWLPIDVTPGYYFDTVALQQMVGLPDTVRKTAALEDTNTNADDIVVPTGGEARNPSDALHKIKNAAAIGLGVLGVLVLLATLLLCLLELLRMVLLWRERKCCQRFTPRERIFHKKDKLFRLLALWGVDAALGWETEKTDRALTLRLPAVSEGEYQRICSLLEKTVYGGIVLEPFEERALDRFLYHLTGQDMKKSLGIWLKLRYACLKKRK